VFVHLVEALIYLVEALIYLLETLVYLLEALIYLVEALIYLLEALIYLVKTLDSLLTEFAQFGHDGSYLFATGESCQEGCIYSPLQFGMALQQGRYPHFQDVEQLFICQERGLLSH